MADDVPREVLRYAERVAAAFRAAFGDRAVAAYLHGSAVLGGFEPSRSDVDILAILDGTPDRARLSAFAASVGRARIRCPAVGLELDVLTLHTASRPLRPLPFLLNFTSGGDGERLVFGDDHGPYGDGLMHILVTRAAGRAVMGAAPQLLLGEIPRAWALAECRAELEWATARASPAYRALNAARAWLFADEGRQASKIDAAGWALGRGHDQVLRAAIEYQRAVTDRLPDGAAADRLIADATRAVARAQQAVDAI